jgi:glycosyltransferase involved in cell wall biosynthesis
VLTYYAPHWTGLTRIAQYAAEGMAARGHQVTVLTSRFRGDLPAEETRNGVRVVRVPTLVRVSRGMVMPGFPAALRRLIPDHDVVQVHTPMLETPLVTRAAHQMGKRVVITHHGDLVMPDRPFDRFVEWTVTALLRRGFTRADHIIVYSDDYLEHSPFLRPFTAKTVSILPPVIFPEPDRSDAQNWRQQLGLATSAVVGFAGRFVEEKGFDFLLRAVRIVARAVPDVRFAYAGERNVVYEAFYQQCAPLIRAVEDRIVWLGLLEDRDRAASFYAMCDAVAVPSRTDAFNLVQVEAMLSGTPVVMTDIPGGRGPVQQTGMGLLVRPRDEVALAAGIVEVLQHREAYVKPRAEIEAAFNPVASLDAYEGVLTQANR